MQNEDLKELSQYFKKKVISFIDIKTQKKKIVTEFKKINFVDVQTPKKKTVNEIIKINNTKLTKNFNKKLVLKSKASVNKELLKITNSPIFFSKRDILFKDLDLLHPHLTQDFEKKKLKRKLKTSRSFFNVKIKKKEILNSLEDVKQVNIPIIVNGSKTEKKVYSKPRNKVYDIKNQMQKTYQNGFNFGKIFTKKYIIKNNNNNNVDNNLKYNIHKSDIQKCMRITSEKNNIRNELFKKYCELKNALRENHIHNKRKNNSVSNSRFIRFIDDIK